ncbi:MAG: DUF2330 domain-containing protein [Proteobacteria bacterium]|nr:DUF2330 domain-containing protein [Pseudomonadota bacterium]
MRAALPLVALLSMIPTAEALACGGFFCNRDFPIDQAGEEVIFGVDEDAGTVDAHVSIAYQGASEDFAWIVPVANVPELFPSSDALFTGLRTQTKPQFYLQWDYSGECAWDMLYDDAEADADGGPPSPTTGGNGVTVVNEERVGPYDSVTLQAETADLLLSWLNNAGYDLPTDLSSVLEPYVASDQYFVALKLSAGSETGDLVPLGMRYEGRTASVPIQLTSVAATPDMPLTVYVLGEARSVPDNYLHVRINEAAINWFTGGDNYADVISRAADEAGGHAFATDFSGATRPGSIFNESSYNEGQLLSATTPFEWIDRLMGMGLPPSAALLAALQDAIPYPQTLADEGVSASNFYDCLSCYSEHVDSSSWDAAAATEALNTGLIDGLREAERILAAHPHISRMTSSLDADEMTVDPIFVFNGDMDQDASNVHTATLQFDCLSGETWEEADRTLILSDGREISLPSQQWIWEHETSEFDVMEPLTSPAAVVIEDLGSDGDGEMMFDYRDSAAAEAEDFRAEGTGACGCATTSPVGTVGLLLGLLPLALRRREDR